MSAHRFTACQVIDSINEHHGGPSLSVTALAAQLAKQGARSHILCLDYPNAGPELPAPGATVHSYRATAAARYLNGFSRIACNGLNALCSGESIDVLHGHGLWRYLNCCSAKASATYKIPLIVSIRGMLERWSLGQHQLKKRIAWMAYEHRNIKQAKVLHATSLEELESIRKLDIAAPVAVIPNGTDLPDLSREGAPDPFPPNAEGRHFEKRLLFLSRLHKKKGLEILLEAWEKLIPAHPEWQLIIAGPDSDGYGATLISQVEQQGFGSRVAFVGPLTGATKHAAFLHARLFVLPSLSENFGNVVAEALSYALPVITTTATPWKTLEEERCGWRVAPEVEAMVQALDLAMRLSDNELRETGERGRRLATAEYSWSSVSKRMLEVYRWMKEGGQAPACVHEC